MNKPKECENIEDVRNEIDRLDKLIIELLGERFQFVKEIIRFKSNAEDVEAKKRYDEVLKIRREWAIEQGLDADIIEKIYIVLIRHFIEEQMKLLKLK